MNPRRRAVLGAAVWAALSVAACSDDDGSSSAAPPGPAALRIDALEPSGGPRASRDASCVELGRDPRATIGVVLELEHWTLRPPGACGSTLQCGAVRLTVDPESSSPLVVASATAFVDAPMNTLGTPLGRHTFHVALVGDDGAPFVDRKTRQPVEDELVIEVTAPGGCGGAPLDAGTDAPSDAPADAPSDAPADAPSDAPADAPSDAPADAPSDAPADAPSDAPADAPSDA
ncbi:MAG: hypothetical protein OZ928_21600, partial [Polyangiaceae bacterium]|nr:hypothetical protein [Polyangiaceae bacterium]